MIQLFIKSLRYKLCVCTYLLLLVMLAPVHSQATGSRWFAESALTDAALGHKLNCDDTSHSNMKIMTRWVADSSIAVIVASIGTKMASSGFTTGAINSLYGYTPANGASYYLASNPNSYITASSLSPYKLISDSGRGTTNYLTGGSAKKIVDSLGALISLVKDSTTKIYNSAGRVYQKIKVWVDTLTPSTSNGQSVDISSAGFTNILNVQAVGYRNTGTITSSPNVSIKSYTNSAVVLNIAETNTATVTILGISVLSGAPTVFASTTGLKILVMVFGY